MINSGFRKSFNNFRVSFQACKTLETQFIQVNATLQNMLDEKELCNIQPISYSEENVNVDILRNFEVNVDTPVENYWCETTQGREVLQIESDISIAQNDDDEAAIEIGVISKRPRGAANREQGIPTSRCCFFSVPTAARCRHSTGQALSLAVVPTNRRSPRRLSIVRQSVQAKFLRWKQGIRLAICGPGSKYSGLVVVHSLVEQSTSSHSFMTGLNPLSERLSYVMAPLRHSNSNAVEHLVKFVAPFEVFSDCSINEPIVPNGFRKVKVWLPRKEITSHGHLPPKRREEEIKTGRERNYDIDGEAKERDHKSKPSDKRIDPLSRSLLNSLLLTGTLPEYSLAQETLLIIKGTNA
ncbi:hypothetical protein Scep_027697 [Stephania cephalantha]|uniref:Uncharacterized protein n=1 Tax=Stephania cephalantha TaxID=152367 RepID=A0AAP0E8F1_9MAGN